MIRVVVHAQVVKPSTNSQLNALVLALKG